MMPIRPVGAHGERFQTSNPLIIVAWLQDQGFVLVVDEPGMVELERDQERIRIDADGQITPLGERADRAARRLLLNSEEK
jgi:hypothetical protein